MQVIKELKDCLFLLMITNQTIMKFLLILSKNIFFQKITTSKLMEETFMISQLMTRLTIQRNLKNIKRTKWWLHHWLFVVFCLFWKKLQINCSYLNKQKALDADSAAMQQIFFTGKNKINRSKYKGNNFSHSWTIKRNNVRICKRNNKSFVIKINGWI